MLVISNAWHSHPTKIRVASLQARLTGMLAPPEGFAKAEKKFVVLAPKPA
jgi:hypothetical protein